MKNINERIALAITTLGGAVQKLQSLDMDGRNKNMAMRELKICLRNLVEIQSAINDNEQVSHIYVNEAPFTANQLRILSGRARITEVIP